MQSHYGISIRQLVQTDFNKEVFTAQMLPVLQKSLLFDPLTDVRYQHIPFDIKMVKYIRSFYGTSSRVSLIYSI